MPDQVCARLHFPLRRTGRGPCSEPSLSGTNLGHPAVPNRKRNSRAMNMCVCQKCSSRRMRRAVCADCHEQMMTRLGTEIRRLQGEILELRVSANRSEEHTSELQSRQYLVCRLLLAKK